jgi:hypothetical protein
MPSCFPSRTVSPATLKSRGRDALRSEIQELLADGIEQDTEVYLLVVPDGRMIVGN